MAGRARAYCLDSWIVLHGAVLITGDPEITKRAVGCRVEDLAR